MTMSKFKPGDKVRVVSLTDVDDKSKVLKSDEEARAADQGLGGIIGQIATFDNYVCDYYDCEITLDEAPEEMPKELAMLEQDIEHA